MFDAHFDAEARLLRLRFAGFWSEADMAACVGRLAEVRAAARSAAEAYGTLADIRDFPVQSPPVIAGFNRFLASIERSRAGRIAILTSGMLIKLQCDRMIAASGTRTFLDEAAARRWLAAA